MPFSKVKRFIPHMAVAHNYSRLLYKECRRTDKGQREFAKLLGGSEILSLIGYVLLKTLEEGMMFLSCRSARAASPIVISLDNRPRNTSDDTVVMLEQLLELEDAVYDSISFGPTLFDDAQYEWTRVWDQMQIHLGKKYLHGGYNKESAEARLWTRIAKAWVLFPRMLDNLYYKPPACAFPRCSQSVDNKPKLRYVCGKCNIATYCGLNCQRRWVNYPRLKLILNCCFGFSEDTGDLQRQNLIKLRVDCPRNRNQAG